MPARLDNPVRLTTCQAENSEGVVREIAAWLAAQTGLPLAFADNIDWRERYARLDAREIDLAWICGLPYVKRAEHVRPLAAPVNRGNRYGGQPIYFSDVIVRADSLIASTGDLAGIRWAYNEPGSWSGYCVVAHWLASAGRTWNFFGEVVEAGSHQAALAMIQRREIDAAAIDSTVLDLELARDPALARKLRVIDTLGPSPQPPWVAGSHVPPEAQAKIQAALLDMHRDPTGRLILAAGLIDRFVTVDDTDYDPIRQMATAAAGLL
jgi:phosphonate transport system substrate-binding protein